jgi:sRNA-binding regulator protein Hfq
LLLALVSFFIPAQESHYLRMDLESIKKRTQVVLIGTGITIFLAGLVFVVKDVKNSSQLLLSMVGLVWLCVIFSFLFDFLFLPAAFLRNGLRMKGAVERKYIVTYVDENKKTLLLYDNAEQEVIVADELFRRRNNLKVWMQDTITISFKKGLLDFNVVPAIQTG